MLNQAWAILRFLGRQHGFYDGSNIKESYLVDWTLETQLDLHGSLAYRQFMKDEHVEEDVVKAIEAITRFNSQIAQKLTENNTTFFASDRLTIADFVITAQYLQFAFNEANSREVVGRAAAVVATTPIVGEYLARVKAELADFLAVRGAYPV